MTRDEMAAEMRQQGAKHPDTGMEELIAVAYIRAIHRGTYLSADAKLTEIGNVLAALDMVQSKGGA